MSNYLRNLMEIKQNIGSKDITIICASKYIDVNKIRELNFLGVNHFGENRVDELLNKKELLSDINISWHYIGHLQSNKVKQVINEIDYLHSLDRLSLAKEIQKHRIKPLNTFIQVNLTNETNKSGVSLENLEQLLLNLQKYDKINVIGLMVMGKHNNINETKQIFNQVNDLANHYNLKEKSMGMSEDYKIAIEEGSTFLRLGRILIK